MCGQRQNKGANRSQSLSQISILVPLGCDGSHWSRRRPGGVLCYGAASHSEALIPSPLLCVRQIRVSISVRLCARWLNPKWQPLQGPNGGEKIRVPKVFNSSIRAKTYSDVPPPSPCLRQSLALWWICHPRFSAHYIPFVPLTLLLFFWPSMPALTESLAGLSLRQWSLFL